MFKFFNKCNNCSSTQFSENRTALLYFHEKVAACQQLKLVVSKVDLRETVYFKTFLRIMAADPTSTTRRSKIEKFLAL